MESERNKSICRALAAGWVAHGESMRARRDSRQRKTLGLPYGFWFTEWRIRALSRGGAGSLPCAGGHTRVAGYLHSVCVVFCAVFSTVQYTLIYSYLD